MIGWQIVKWSLIGQMKGAGSVCDAGMEGHENDAPSLLFLTILLEAVDISVEATLKGEALLQDQ
jgi:hypothetical protein